MGRAENVCPLTLREGDDNGDDGDDGDDDDDDDDDDENADDDSSSAETSPGGEAGGRCARPGSTSRFRKRDKAIPERPTTVARQTSSLSRSPCSARMRSRLTTADLLMQPREANQKTSGQIAVRFPFFFPKEREEEEEEEKEKEKRLSAIRVQVTRPLSSLRPGMAISSNQQDHRQHPNRSGPVF